jgi:hypothetical protein
MEVVVTRRFIGKLAKEPDGEWTTENQLVRTHRPSLEWNLFLQLGKMMYSKVELVEVFDEKIEFGTKKVKGQDVKTQKHIHTKIEASDDIKREIEDIHAEKIELTPDQKKIADLEAKLESFMASGASKTEDPNKSGYELKPSVAKYKEVFGKKPHHTWSEEQINEKIEAKLKES